MKQLRINRRGSALLLALCAIALLSMTVLSLARITHADLQESARKELDFRARQLARSGLEIGLYPELDKNDPLLRQQFGPNESFSVSFSGESAKLNINFILAAKKEKTLRRLFELWGLKSETRSALVDCLADWVDGDPLKRLNGAEAEEYRSRHLDHLPKNRPFRSVEEMAGVAGMAELERIKPDWRNFFTVATDGKLDLNEASPDLIAAVCDIPLRVAESFAKKRLGPDLKEGSRDDFRYSNMAEVQKGLGLSDDLFDAVVENLSLQSNLRCVTSIGTVAGHEHRLVAVLRPGTHPTQYFSWTEF